MARQRESDWRPAPLHDVDPGEVKVSRWESMADLLKAKCLASNERHNNKFLFDPKGKPSDDDGQSKDWYGANNGIDYADKIAKGDKEMAAALAECRAEIGDLPKIASIKRRRKMGEEGECIDLDRLYQGETGTMWEGFKSEYRPGATRHVRMMVNVSCAWFHEGPALRWRGAAACVLADILEESGYQTEIVMCSYSRGVSDDEPQRMHLLEVPVKLFGEPMDIDHLASTLATQSALRIAGFMAKLATIERSSGHLGFPTPKRPPEPLVSHTDIWLDSITSKEMAMDCLRHQMDELIGAVKADGGEG